MLDRQAGYLPAPIFISPDESTYCDGAGRIIRRWCRTGGSVAVLHLPRATERGYRCPEEIGMAEKVAKAGIERDPGWMYYVKDRGVWKVRRKSPDVPTGRPARVATFDMEMDTDYIYFVDRDGDVARARRASTSNDDDDGDDATDGDDGASPQKSEPG